MPRFKGRFPARFPGRHVYEQRVCQGTLKIFFVSFFNMFNASQPTRLGCFFPFENEVFAYPDTVRENFAVPVDRQK